MPYPRRFLSSGEEIAREFHPHWIRLITPVAVELALIALGVLVAVFVDAIDLWIGVVAGLVLGVGVTIPAWVRWKTTWFVVTSERIITRSGLFNRTGKEIPLEVINDVAFAQTFFERLFRSGDLLIESAGEQGQSRFTDIPDPEGVQADIYSLREERTVLLRGGGGQSVGQELETLARLRAEGVLTDEEFAAQKDRLLGGE
jgi:membrane protein YdbS with pleckstrin-like domain